MTSPMSESGSDNVKVVVRCRPLSEMEIGQGHTNVVKIDALRGSISVEHSEQPPKQFTFDTVFDQGCAQMHVYNTCARPIVENVLQGYNGTIFAYGQTGTGKTYTMEGRRDKPEEKGIIPNSFAHIFAHISEANEGVRFLVRVSYLEIYNEEIRDLLAKNQGVRLEVKERPDVGVYVKDLSAVTVGSADDMDKIMTLGNKNRSVGATAMNEHSSRSHAIFTVTIECSSIGMDKQTHFRVGKLHLVDLAGSERQSKSQASGQRLKEAGKINLSLSTLGNVISALVDGKSTFIPYRNSNLTRLLQDSLGGNSKTLMCANIGPASYNYDETLSTLRYANRAKNIKNAPKINEDPKDALLRKFQEEIEALKRQLEDGGGEEEGSGDESGDDETGEGGAEGGGRKKRKRLNSAQMREIEALIDVDRRKLQEEKGMAEGERNALEAKLKQREDDLNKAREAHDALQKKLAAIEKRVIIGGVNVLEKHDEQARLLNENNKELESRRAREAELRAALQQKEAERIDIEEKYKTLEEEVQGKTRKLKKVWGMLTSAKSEMADLETEHQREMEGLLDNVRELSKELRLQMLVIDSFIPKHYQELVERYVHWNDEIGDWELKCIAYTGNNMRKHEDNNDDGRKTDSGTGTVVAGNYHPPDLSGIYLSYDGNRRGAANLHTMDGSRTTAKTTVQRKTATKREKKEARLRTLFK